MLCRQLNLAKLVNIFFKLYFLVTFVARTENNPAMRYVIVILISSFMFLSCADKPVKEYGVEVVARYPHDTESYTQGLFFHEGQMYESTGVHGRSTFRKVEIFS